MSKNCSGLLNCLTAVPENDFSACHFRVPSSRDMYLFTIICFNKSITFDRSV